VAIALAIYLDKPLALALPNTRDCVGPWRACPVIPALVGYDYPHRKVAIVHSVAQTALRFDLDVTAEMADLAGHDGLRMQRDGYVQRMAVSTMTTSGNPSGQSVNDMTGALP
jgi:hypothetical protein